MSALAVLALVQAVTLTGRVQEGVLVRPDTVHVGDPFVVTVRIRAPLGATIEFPASPDSTRGVQPLDPVQVQTAADSAAVDQTASYRLAAWRVGALPIDFPEVLVRQDIGVRRIPITGTYVVVASVLPADSALRVPRPPRDVFTFGPPWWMWALLAAALASLASLAWWLWRRRRRRQTVPRVAPLVLAEREFDRVDALGLVAAGECARHADLMVEALRSYLAAVVPGVRVSQTTSELAASLRRARLDPQARCAALLSEVDLVKFAGRRLSPERATAVGMEVRDIAATIHEARRIPEPAKAA